MYDGQLAAVSPSASSPEITGLSPWLFRVIPSDSANGIELARFAKTLGHKRAAILYENNSYGRGLADSFRRAFGGEITSLEPVAVDGKEVEPYLAYLKLHEPGLIFVAGSDGSGLEILREARRLGIKSDFLGGDGWAGVTTDTAAVRRCVRGRALQRRRSATGGVASSCGRSARSSAAIRTASPHSRTMRRWSSRRRSSAQVPTALRFATISPRCARATPTGA